ncbi:sugar ABC transporter permease [Sulfolobus sp. A20-N-F6]|nr:sugar ABC transporter permease [Sulfolobus sp. A20-N-F8]TRM74166.1 sugar ABC transporter permease [Sulfolobus sp. E5]TRM74362.1 sugar ABC transporter permease [Sulfolobus sp. B5]TRM80052.1 sugar ABC transporter permease [Sulfolobus sp. D5]TRM82807.1 sugar ABC transporter permease [Sulfolobus sp. A20-N-F6]TRM83952.1 sugar ABC transporter permease [Sulfolobus sp. F3]TRM86206.1 sugar ABC transporter permease [Sulfolobus sp. C3]TRM86216.1 sugar ABC transporter permease [Sulfolobus sp. E3]TRM
MMKRGTVILVLPTAIFSAILLYLVLWNAAMSFMNWSLLNPKPTLVGLKTFITVASSFEFKNSLIHSLELSAILVLVGNALGILLAGLLYFLTSNKARSVFLSIIIYPLAISMAVNALIWLWLYNINIGIDWLFVKIGLPQFPWLSSTSTMFPSLIIVSIWAYTGIAALFYLAGFMNIDKTIVEAARLDGANSFKILYKFLIPNSTNSFIISTALLFLFSFRIFSLPYILSGGPTNVFLQTLVVYMYYLFTVEFFSQATAVATIITVIASIIIIPYALIIIRRWIRR